MTYYQIVNQNMLMLIKTLKPELNNRYKSIKQSDSERYQKQNSDS